MLSILIVFLPIFCFGQKNNNVFTEEVKLETSIRFTKDDGLPSNFIRSVTETDDGFIWIGTGDGLSRFDGTQFKNFQYDPADSTTIYDNRITPIIADSQNLYMGTHLSFSMMDLQTEKCRNFQFRNFQVSDTLDKKYPTRVLCLDKAKNGEIWMGTFTDGIFRYSPEADTFRCYHFPHEEVSRHFPAAWRVDHILGIQQDRFNDSIIWAATIAGLLQVNAVTHEMKWFHNPKTNEKTFLPENSFRSIYQHSNGLIYLTSWYATVYIFDPKIAEFYPLLILNDAPKERADGYRLLNTPIYPIVQKNENEIWIRSLEGLMTYNIETQKWIALRWHDIKKGEFYGVSFIDSQRRAWMTGNGLYLFDPPQQQFIQYDFDHLNPKHFGFSYYLLKNTPESDFAILPRDADGIYFLDTKKNNWDKYLVPKKHRHANGDIKPRGFSQSPSGGWTIITPHGVFNFDPKRKTYQPLPIPAHLIKTEAYSVLWDSQGRLWLGTNNDKLIRWTPSNNKWEVFKEELNAEGPSINVGAVTRLFEDSQQNIWIKRGGGFSVFHQEKNTFYNFLEKINPEQSVPAVRNFAEDQQGRVWIISHNGLLAYAEIAAPEKGIIKKYDLMSSHQIIAFSYLRVDAKGMLWCLGNDHLYEINPNTMNVVKHSLNYGVTEEARYNFEILEDGRFVIGGKNKVWVAEPKNLLPNAEQPKPYLTRVSVLQEPLQTDTTTHLLSHMNLDHTENFFSFDFSSISFTHGMKNKFRYRLKGFDDKWTETSDRRFANFTNVPSGDYLFELQAANNEGIWNKEKLNFDIHIATPWWKTIWFWTLVILGVSTIGYLLYRWRIGEVRREERLHADYEKKLADMEMSALRAQMNPHFIFNSLNSIEYYIISNEPEKASDYLNRFSRLIRLILQNSKNTIVPLKDDLEALKLYIEIESMRFDNLFDYEIKIEEGMDVEKTKVPPMLLQPYVENAIWHGLMQKKGEKGRIDLVLRRDHGSLICLIEDNGIGREAAGKLKSKSASKRKSFGMKITKDRLETLNQLANTEASVQIFDLKNDIDEAKGTRVELVIPL